MAAGRADEVAFAVAAECHPLFNSGAIHLLRSLAAVDWLAGVTPARLSALSVLVSTGPRSLGELAAAEGVAVPTMTRIVDGLAGLGLAERQRLAAAADLLDRVASHIRRQNRTLSRDAAAGGSGG